MSEKRIPADAIIMIVRDRAIVYMGARACRGGELVVVSPEDAASLQAQGVADPLEARDEARRGPSRRRATDTGQPAKVTGGKRRRTPRDDSGSVTTGVIPPV